jgi:hypothetical protein
MRWIGALLLSASLMACGSTVPTPRAPKGSSDANPLGPSYVLIPLPTEDDALLGRVLPELPEAGRSLEEIARANPCADKLSEPKETPLGSSFEDAQELAVGVRARALLGTFGFSGDAERATHFVYKLETQKRIARTDTPDYDACCKEKGCGYGYISALVYGEGEYSTGEEASASGSVDVAVGSGGGTARLKILHKRKVKGWFAAVVTVTDRSKASQLGPLGVATDAGITETTVPETVRALYERDKLAMTGVGQKYVWRDGRGQVLTENEFVRRFRAVTGSDELDDVERRRNSGIMYVMGGLTALSVGAAVFGFLNLERACQVDDFDRAAIEGTACTGTAKIDEDRSVGVRFHKTGQVSNTAGVALAIAGSVGAAGFGTWFLVTVLSPDGSRTDHALTDRDAVLYTDRYNRALLRKTVKDVQRSRSPESRALPTLEVRPSIGLGSLGLHGRF